MPKPGFTSITCHDAVYYAFRKWYEAHKDELRLVGINSISAAASKILIQFLANHTIDDLLNDSEREQIRKILAGYKEAM